ncbi:HPr kinase/phosphorylase [Cochlodiniinecator piscidefendens]|uniref:HPr kinase/phosphorylase n=1 Tax=Cochlodiniinecator piscidefendens TaxID=2715756 RepID=UPI002F3F7407
MLHATTVSVEGAGLLIRGPSGSGKSGLALQLLGYGAELVADDRTEVGRLGGRLIARCPETLTGLIEARGVGILRAVTAGPVDLRWVVDLETVEKDRLPHPRECRILGVRLPLLAKVNADYFAAALLQLVKHGRHA